MITSLSIRKICKSHKELTDEICECILERKDGQKESYEKNDVIIIYSNDNNRIIAFVRFVGHFDINLVAYREALKKLEYIIIKWFGYTQDRIVSYGVDFMELYRNVNGLMQTPLVGDFEGLIQFTDFGELMLFEEVLNLVSIGSPTVITPKELDEVNKIVYVNILPGRKMILKLHYKNTITSVGQPLVAHNVGEVIYDRLNFIDPLAFDVEGHAEEFTEEAINKWFEL